MNPMKDALDGVLSIGDGDKVDVITHQTVGQEIQRGLPGRLRDQIEVFLSVIILYRSFWRGAALPCDFN